VRLLGLGGTAGTTTVKSELYIDFMGNKKVWLVRGFSVQVEFLLVKMLGIH
jgi:hypothetical protein